MLVSNDCPRLAQGMWQISPNPQGQTPQQTFHKVRKLALFLLFHTQVLDAVIIYLTTIPLFKLKVMHRHFSRIVASLLEQLYVKELPRNLVPLAFPTKICKHFSCILPRDAGSAVCEMIFLYLICATSIGKIYFNNCY